MLTWLVGVTTWAGRFQAEARVCALANQSVEEIAMFEIRQGDPRHGHGTNFPETFWIPQLERFMSGAGCDADIPPVLHCPTATVGPVQSWTVSASDGGCCEAHGYRGPGETCNASCAEKECATAHMFWKPENYSVHPYTCCAKPPGEGL